MDHADFAIVEVSPGTPRQESQSSTESLIESDLAAICEVSTLVINS